MAVRKILVTGANGFVGSQLCSLLEREGYGVVRAVRRAPATDDGLCYTEVGELDGSTAWSEALQGVDAVVHTAARVHVLHEQVSDPDRAFRTTNTEATLHLAREMLAAGAKRIVFISTIGVLGNHGEEPFTEEAKPNPSNAYSASKWQAEQQLMELSRNTGLEVSIIRPPLVYGAGVKANFYRLMEAVYRQRYLPFGRVINKRDFVSVGNLCDLIRVCIEHPSAAGETFLVADGEAISTPDLIRLLAWLMAKKPRLIHIPVRLINLAAAYLGRERQYQSVCCSLRIDTSKAHRILGWSPPQTLRDGIEQTVAWYVGQANPQQQDHRS